MKKALLIFVLIISLVSTVAFADGLIKTGVVIKIGEAKAVVDGEYKVLDVPAEIIDGRTFVPLRFCSEALDADVKFIDETQTAVIKKENITLELIAGEKVYKVNGELFESDALPVLKNGRLLVPVRVVSESLSTQVGWYEDTQIVTLGVIDNETAVKEYLENLF